MFEFLDDRVVERFVGNREVQLARHVRRAGTDVFTACLEVAVNSVDSIVVPVVGLHDDGVQIVREGLDEVLRGLRSSSSPSARPKPDREE